MPTKLLGIDPSLNSTGIAFRVGGKVNAYCIGGGTFRGIARIKHVRNAVNTALDTYAPSLVIYEGYALGFRGKSNIIFDLGELGGVLKLLILERGIDILLVPPTSLKMFVTGKGNAKKEQVSLALEQNHGLSFSTSDQYDAAGLLLLGEMLEDRRRARRTGKVGFTERRRKILDTCTLLRGF